MKNSINSLELLLITLTKTHENNVKIMNEKIYEKLNNMKMEISEIHTKMASDNEKIRKSIDEMKLQMASDNKKLSETLEYLKNALF